jgi:DNA polymerase-3 subunit epsilon
LCDETGIANPQRHRAYGDAKATAGLFELLLSIDPNPTEISLQGLNSNLNPETIKNLPGETGVYYFLDENKEVIYVGKSLNIKSRVMSHLTNSSTKRALEMKNKVTEINFEITGSELIALLLEAHEISTRLPLYNRAQRRNMYNHGLFYRPNDEGYICFRIGRLTDDENDVPLTTFNSQMAAKNFLFSIAEELQLCQKLCGLYTAKNSCFQYKIKECRGACIGEENPATYNKRAQKLIDRYLYKNENFLIIDKGRTNEECSVVHIENSRYLGFGFTEKEFNGFDPVSLFKDCIKPYTENKHVHSIIRSYIAKHPGVKIINLQNGGEKV